MDFYTINTALRNQLLLLPETGMGYQVAEVTKAGSYISEKMLVLNAAVGIPLAEKEKFPYTYLKEYGSWNYARFVAVAKPLGLSLNKVYSRKEWSNIVAESGFTASGWPKSPAKDSPIVFANGTDKYVRLSAYADDIRVDKVNGKLLPGSYSTTEGDYQECVNTKDSPNERYALPNEETIQHAFYFCPLITDTLQKGTVEPANNKRGGGKEVYFNNGTSAKTYLGMTDYGKFL